MHNPALLTLFLLLSAANFKLVAHELLPSSVQHDQLVNVNALSNISNLQANNWVLGSLTQGQYYSKRFEITKSHNTSLCPLEHPFVLSGTSNCGQCPLSTPIFNLQTDTCVKCPSGESFNQETQQCQNENPKDRPVSPQPSNDNPQKVGSLADTSGFTNITNLYANNWVLGKLTMDQYNQKRFLITKTTNTTLCPAQKPYVLKGKTTCEQCPTDKPVFSLENDTCIPCASGEVFSTKTNQCQDKNHPNNTTPKQPTPTAPVDAPLIDTTNFINITNLDASNWILGDLTEDEYHAKRFEITKNHNTTLCPIATPYVLSGSTKCEQCPSSKPIFVLENDTCVGCQPGQKFNNDTNQCENANSTSPKKPQNQTSTNPNGTLIDTDKYKNVTNLDGKNWILGNMTVERYYVERFNTISLENVTQCDIQTPYVIDGHGGICEQCPVDRPIFVLQNSTCLPCPPNTTWSSQQKDCVPENVTKPNATKPNDTKITTPTPNKTETNNTKPNATEPNATKPNVTQPNATEPNATKPNATEPNATKPNVTQPNATEPNNTKPNATETNGTQANTTKPNVTQPNATKPNDTKITTPTPSINKTQANTTQQNNTSNTTTPNTTKNDTKITTPTPTPNKTEPASNQTNQTPNKTQPSSNQTGKGDTNITTPTPTKNTTSTTNTTSKNDTKITTPKPSINKTEQIEVFTCTDYQECQKNQFFDYVAGQCSKCEFGQYFDGQYQACLYCPDSAPLLDAEFNCARCPSGKSIDRKTNKCL